MTPEECTEILAIAARKLGEHFDAVQIMVSYNDEGTTRASFNGCGNWYARQGMAHSFINTDIAQENALEIASRLNPSP